MESETNLTDYIARRWLRNDDGSVGSETPEGYKRYSNASQIDKSDIQ